MSDDKFYTPEEVAELMRVTKKTIYDWMREKRLPYIQAGERTRLISHSDLMRFVDNNRVEGGSSKDGDKYRAPVSVQY